MSEKVHVQITIAALPPAVFAAITQSEQISKWFSEYADVSLAEKRYDFWGKLTPDAPDRTRGKHTILTSEPDRKLRFTWRLQGAATIVEFSLTPKGKQTELVLLHEGLPEWKAGQFSFADFWDIALENLRSWIERKTIGNRCDYSMTPKGVVKLDIEINATRDTVYNALIQPETLNRYMSENAAIEPRVGGRYDVGWKDGGPVKILELVPSQKLSYSWEYKNEVDTIVTWTLEGSGNKTKLILVHSGFAPDRECGDYNTGWMAFLNRIKSLSENETTWTRPRYLQTDYAGVTENQK